MHEITVPEFVIHIGLILVYSILSFWGWHVINKNRKKLQMPGSSKGERIRRKFWIGITIPPFIGFIIVLIIAIIDALRSL